MVGAFLVKAKPLGGEDKKEGKKGKDRGIDGVINFIDAKARPKRVIVQVKKGAACSLCPAKL
jgi:site-specific DNA-methyltransferase (adenine-specific)